MHRIIAYAYPSSNSDLAPLAPHQVQLHEQLVERIEIHGDLARFRRVPPVRRQLHPVRLPRFYGADCPAAEGSQLNDRIHLVHTPKHGSWLNVAELEFNALHRQYMDCRIESRALVTSETAAWAEVRNREQTGVDWQLSVDDARTKLKHPYPKIKTN